jgi:nitroreductase
MQLMNAIKKRKSVKRFSNKKPNWRKVIRAIDAVRFAPAAGNQFAMKFIMISDKETIQKLAESAQQQFIKDAHFIVVAVSDDSKLERSYGERAARYSRQQAGAAIQNFLLTAEEQGLSTVWIGHFVEEQVKNILKIPEGMVVEAFFPIGHETKIKRSEARKPELENIIYFGKWGNKKMEPETRVTSKNA